MAVESRFVVIRHGVEVETFMDKKAADEYDKMLDMADNLSEMFENAPVELAENIREELSIYLAQQREDVLIALQAKKPRANKTVNKTASKTANKADKTEQANSDSASKSSEKANKESVVDIKQDSSKKPSKGKVSAA